ncbi:phage regulatory protein/antirepressor Ant [Ligilactobacillus sp. WILCCON 0076]|uniref:Phage regulatory protein/antirepressor Ant n=1 Tax=Ligilactobacillus ubinensis TaxID=2876789 RepID=A0A9X2JLB6_9LACO|nr:phage regulatory protein/antirepressor Ant [Ligilactobacillus ubinensis]MCP0885886.1 phage regulatory protein/antirepressor Ant [Ligilactobacillus ubinensis]
MDLKIITPEFSIESREVAKMVGKRHSNLVRDIDIYIEYLLNSELSSAKYFVESSYKDKSGKTNKCYLITKMGCEMIANKLTGQKGVVFTASYVDKFNKMERKIEKPKFEIPQTFSEALRLAADAIDENRRLKPAADYTYKILANKGLETVSVIAKNYGMSSIKFNKLLHDLGIQFKQGGVWYLYAKYQDKGYTHTEPFEYPDTNGNKKLNNTMKWTQKGQKFLYDFLKAKGILPIIEMKVTQ